MGDRMEAPKRLTRLLVVGGCVAATIAAGCSGHYESDFPVIVVNRTANPIQAIANGSAVGLVEPGRVRVVYPEASGVQPEHLLERNGADTAGQSDLHGQGCEDRGAVDREEHDALPERTDVRPVHDRRLPEHGTDRRTVYVLADCPDDQPGRLVQRLLIQREQRRGEWHVRVGFRRRDRRHRPHHDTPLRARRHDDGDTDCHERHEADIHIVPDDLGRDVVAARSRQLRVLSDQSRDQSGRHLHGQRHSAPGRPWLSTSLAAPPRGPATRGTSATERWARAPR